MNFTPNFTPMQEITHQINLYFFSQIKHGSEPVQPVRKITVIIETLYRRIKES